MEASAACCNESIEYNYHTRITYSRVNGKEKKKTGKQEGIFEDSGYHFQIKQKERKRKKKDEIIAGRKAKNNRRENELLQA